MKPLYIDYSGADAPRWVPFAKKKMQQFREHLERSGLAFGRKYLKFDNVTISFLMTPSFAKLRVQAGSPPTFFGLYSVNLSGSITYQYLAAFDDEGAEQWRYSFGSHGTFSGLVRRALGCSADGTKVLVREVDGDTLRIKEVTSGVLTSTAEFDLAGAGYSTSFIDTPPRISLSGTRAIFAGPFLSGSSPIQYVGFVYDKETEPQIQSLEITVADASTGSLILLGSADLETAYFAHQKYLLTASGVQPVISIPRVTRTAAVDDNPPTNTVDVLDINTILGASHYVVVGEIASAPDGEIAVIYAAVTPPTFSSLDTNEVRFYVHADGADTEVGSPLTDFIGSGASSALEEAQSVFSLNNESASVAYAFTEATSGAVLAASNGYILNGVATVVAESIVVVDPVGTLVLADGTKYVVRRPEGDFELVDDLPYDSGRTLHAFDGGDNVFGGFTALVQPTAEVSVFKWVPSTDPDTGEVTGYPAAQTLGDTPLSITVTPVDPEVEETANLVSSHVLNVYVQRVVQS